MQILKLTIQSGYSGAEEQNVDVIVNHEECAHRLVIEPGNGTRYEVAVIDSDHNTFIAVAGHMAWSTNTNIGFALRVNGPSEHHDAYVGGKLGLPEPGDYIPLCKALRAWFTHCTNE